MHIPENYLSPETCFTFTAVMLPLWKRAASKLKVNLDKRKVPLIAIGAAFSFLVMMFNIPLIGGTTGHVIGAALLSIILGPWTTLIIESVVLFIQALFFGDGGLLSFGANCFNIAFVMPFTAHWIYRYVVKVLPNSLKSKDVFAAGIAGYISMNLAALTTAIMFGLQPLLFADSSGMALYSPYGLNIAIPAMLIPHLLIAGVLEAFITGTVYAYIKNASPELLVDLQTETKMTKLAIGIITLILLSPLGLLASGSAWGEWEIDSFQETIGYIPSGMENGFSFKALIPDYSIIGLNDIVAYLGSAIVGVAIIFFVSKMIIGRMKRNGHS